MESPGCNERARAYAAIFVRCASIGIFWHGVAGLRGFFDSFARLRALFVISPSFLISLQFRFCRVSQKISKKGLCSSSRIGILVIRFGEDNRSANRKSLIEKFKNIFRAEDANFDARVTFNCSQIVVNVDRLSSRRSQKKRTRLKAASGNANRRVNNDRE